MEQEKLLERCVEIANKVDELVGKFALGYNGLSFESSVKYDDNGKAKDIIDVVDFKGELFEISDTLKSYAQNEFDENNWNDVINIVKLLDKIKQLDDEVFNMIECYNAEYGY